MNEAGKLCPYTKHEPASLQEHQAWQTIKSLPGCVKTDPMNGAPGLDMATLLQFSERCGHDMAVVSELLAEANLAFLQAMADTDSHDE